MPRLISRFSNGLPGLGLLLLRLIGGTAMIVRAFRPHDSTSVLASWAHLVAALGGLFLLAGLWTRVAGAIVVIGELWIAISHTQDPWLPVLLASLGASLALVGPGRWSIDAQRFGWRRIAIRPPNK